MSGFWAKYKTKRGKRMAKDIVGRGLLMCLFATFFFPESAAADAQGLKGEWVFYDKLSLSPYSNHGLVVIGVDTAVSSEGDPAFRWRSYEPSTGKLGPSPTIEPAMKAALGNVATLVRNPKSMFLHDKRIDPNGRQRTYRMAELAPGDYVLEGVRLIEEKIWRGVEGVDAVLNGEVPVVHIEAGRITYAGDIAVIHDRKRKLVTAAIEEGSLDDAKAFIAGYSGIHAEFLKPATRVALLQCQPARGFLWSELACDGNRSLAIVKTQSPALSGSARDHLEPPTDNPTPPSPPLPPSAGTSPPAP